MKSLALIINGKTITLTENELAIINAAVSLVVPTGGGSDELNLSLKLQEIIGSEPNDAMQRRYANLILEEAEDVGACERTGARF